MAKRHPNTSRRPHPLPTKQQHYHRPLPSQTTSRHHSSPPLHRNQRTVPQTTTPHPNHNHKRPPKGRHPTTTQLVNDIPLHQPSHKRRQPTKISSPTSTITHTLTAHTYKHHTTRPPPTYQKKNNGYYVTHSTNYGKKPQPQNPNIQTYTILGHTYTNAVTCVL